jgi:hypothetical protein
MMQKLRVNSIAMKAALCGDVDDWSIVGQALRLPFFSSATDAVALQFGNMPQLVISGAAHELTDEVITIGRATDNMIVIDDPSVSGRHAQLQLAGEVYRLKDLESTNGTCVNGIPVTETALRFDDRIRFGAVDALFEPDMRGSQPLPQLEELEARPAESSVAPVDFTNASPFPRRKQKNDPIRTVILAAAAVALLVFLGSMIAVLMMWAPVL